MAKYFRKKKSKEETNEKKVYETAIDSCRWSKLKNHILQRWNRSKMNSYENERERKKEKTINVKRKEAVAPNKLTNLVRSQLYLVWGDWVAR